MVTVGIEILFFFSLVGLSGIALGFHLIHVIVNFPFFGNSAKILACINLCFIVLFLLLNLFVLFDSFYLFLIALMALSNVGVLQYYLRH